MKTIRNIITICLLLCISTICFSSCEKFADDTPKAIKKLIRENKKMFGEGQVVEYDYYGENIYKYWTPRIIDSNNKYYDAKGNKLWEFGGGWGGTGTPLEGFNETTMFKRIIWTDNETKEYLEKFKYQ